MTPRKAPATPTPGYALIDVSIKREDLDFARVNDSTNFVHIVGFLRLWVLKRILELAPNLKTIRITPTCYHMLQRGRHIPLCEARGVQVLKGHHEPRNAWAGVQRTSKKYDERRALLMNMSPARKRLFDELIEMGEVSIKIVSRYFCLNGEAYTPVHILLEQFDYSPSACHSVSSFSSGLMHYLYPDQPITKRGSRMLLGMRRRLQSFRRKKAVEAALLLEVQMQARDQEALGLKRLPLGLPVARIPLFAKLLKLRKPGWLDKVDARAAAALIARFDLGNEEPAEYRSLNTVSKTLFGGCTREWIRKLEVRALQELGISEE